LVAALTSVTAGASATKLLHTVTLTNKTTKCAWITMYQSTNLSMGWHIISSAGSQPQWLRAGQTHVFVVNAEQVKARAEIKANDDCTGATIVDTYDKRTDIGWNNVPNLNAHIVPSSNGYNLWF